MLHAYLLTVGIASLTALLLFAYDKLAAGSGRMRIPVLVLLMAVALGGAAGALIGMLLFHHKTRKWHFRIPVFFCLAVQLLALSYLLTHTGVTV